MFVAKVNGQVIAYYRMGGLAASERTAAGVDVPSRLARVAAQL
jgi:hypothetical protein